MLAYFKPKRVPHEVLSDRFNNPRNPVNSSKGGQACLRILSLFMLSIFRVFVINNVLPQTECSSGAALLQPKTAQRSAYRFSSCQDSG